MNGSQWWAAAPSDLASEEYAAYVLDAVDDGLLYWQWRDLQVGPLTVQCMTQPLAVGTAEDHVHLYGITARLADQIVERWNRGSEEHDRYCGAPRFIMSPTSLLLDAMAADKRAVLVGPFLDTPGNNRKEDARRHSRRLQRAQRQRAVEYFGEHAHSFMPEWIGSVLWPECKTYVLNPRHRPGFACIYGWHVRSGWSPSAIATAYAGGTLPTWFDVESNPDLVYTRVIQPEQWAHSYSAFQDYSMAALFVSAFGWLKTEHHPDCQVAHSGIPHCTCPGGRQSNRVDLRQLLADPERAHLVTVHGPQDWHTLGGPR